ncbi:MAG: hypothetical protein HYT98_02780 [Candidatus Sungbacteria bacterium]|nr:hypothetical protein [Candidatus Sungbacteria bacterium]
MNLTHLGTTYNFIDGLLHVQAGPDRILHASHQCTPEPVSTEYIHTIMNFRLGRHLQDGRHAAVLFCQECGLRVKFEWASRMDLQEIDTQLEAAAIHSWSK